MYLSSQGILVILVVGLVAGWLAGKIVQGKAEAEPAFRFYMLYDACGSCF